MNSQKYKKYLQKKIAINMKKWKYDKRYKSQKQALAVSYSQTREYFNKLRSKSLKMKLKSKKLKNKKKSKNKL